VLWPFSDLRSASCNKECEGIGGGDGRQGAVAADGDRPIIPPDRLPVRRIEKGSNEGLNFHPRRVDMIGALFSGAASRLSVKL
jgi:hypothetical protein